MQMLGLALFIGALAAGPFGCSSDSSGSQSIGACNTLVDDAPTISLMLAAGSAPTPAGGTVVDGTYVFTAATLYTTVSSVPPTSFSAVLQIAGTTMQQVGTINGAEQRYTSTIDVNGTSVTTSDTCPMPNVATHQFTATATELRIYDASALGTVEQMYMKR